MAELTSRQQLILGLVIREYVASETENENGTRRVQPVGSKGLVERYNLDISPATIRNELARLEEQGYLTHPHTSAGRIPTDSGYRYFVETLMGDVDLTAEEQRTIVHQFHQARLDLDQWMKLAASVLARTSGSVSIVTPPRAQQARLKHLQLISTQGRLVLLILVFVDGAVKQEMLTLADPLSQSDLDTVSTKLTATFNNRTAAEIHSRRSELSALEADVLARVTEIMSRADQWAAADVYRDGLSDVLRKPEFEDRESAEGLLKIFEERSLLEDVLSTALNPAVNGVQVVIGSEGRWAELHDCSLVLSRYGVPDRATGAVGVVGPTRMPYGRTISAVRYVSVLMTKKAYRTAKRIHVKDKNQMSSSMDAVREALEIQTQANAEQIAALENKVAELETQAANLSAQVQAAQLEREQLKAQAAENLDGWQRARAEFANYKRRVEAERTELTASAGAEALKRVLPAVDDFERAMQTLPDDLKDNPWINGVSMVQRKLNAALEQSGITPLVTNPGDPFDPNVHEAITHEDSDQVASGQIIGEVQRGYKLGDRILRPAMVRVAR